MPFVNKINKFLTNFLDDIFYFILIKLKNNEIKKALYYFYIYHQYFTFIFFIC